ncbi:MAG: hypothetical protein EOP21_12685 [Hyphomicrobiales bacterium]|nr:MAG: hypothetical protein EOP21_12685 [Hyphomicrobiales bacterium]
MSGMLPLLIAIGAYVALLAVLLIVTQPVRREMVLLADELATDYHSTSEQQQLRMIVDSAMSSKFGPLLIVAGFIFIYEAVVGARVISPVGLHRLRKDPRFQQLLARHVVSVLASNPIASVLAFVPITVGALLYRLRGEASFKDTAEQPVLRATMHAAA